jgi:PleD family two-component response regulator
VMRATDTDAGAPSITLSAGVAGAEPGDTLETLLARADDALYRAKLGGRNRVEI